MTTTRSIRRSLASGLLIATAGFPGAAEAKPNLEPVGSSATPAVSQPAPPPSPATEAGFQWADAGIGAAGAVVLLGTGALAYAAPRRRRAQRAVSG
jgi:hypothetical protein